MIYDIAIRGGKILTLNQEHHLIIEGLILIKNSIIQFIGEEKNYANEYQAKKVINAQDKLIMPGMINTHTHVGMSLFRGFADDLPLHVWLEKYVWPTESKYINAENVSLGSMLSIIEMIKSGVTAFNDMYFFEKEIGEAATKAGIRAMLGEGILDFPTPNMKSPEDGIAYTLDMAQEFKDNDLIEVGFAPHAPYSCSKKQLIQIRELAERHQLKVSIHLAETKKEYEDSFKRTDLSPVAYLNSIGLLNENLIIAHGNYLNSEDLSLLETKKAQIAHNPNSNMKLASGICPVPELMERNINVALGTDGPASNNRQSILNELQQAAKLHKIGGLDPEAVNARQAVEMATTNGAKALGMDHLTGSLEIGKKADLILIDTKKAHLVPVFDHYSQIAYNLENQDIHTSIINGELVMENRKLTKINESEIIDQIVELTKGFEGGNNIPKNNT